MTPLVQSFVLHFGEMGGRWGVNRTVGQIYALIYVTARPLNADAIAQELGFSRSNVSMGLKELEAWRLVRLQHLPNDRREYFSTPEDVWTIFRALLAERRRRELEPTLSMLRDSLLETSTTPEDEHAQARIRAMHDLLDLSSKWFDDIQRLDSRTLTQLMRLGARVQRLLAARNKLSMIAGGKARPASGRDPATRGTDNE